MTNAEILSDLEYVKSMAEEGRNAPLLGGRIGVMWGVLLALVLTGHWLIVTGLAGLPPQALGWLWLGYAIIGGAGSFILGKSLEGKAGITAAGNRAETIVWTSFTLTLAVCFVGILANIILNKGTVLSFDLMLVLGWFGQSLAYMTVARISRDNRVKVPAVLALITAFITLILYGNPVIYLAGGVSAVFTIVLPGLAQIRREPSDVI